VCVRAHARACDVGWKSSNATRLCCFCSCHIWAACCKFERVSHVGS